MNITLTPSQAATADNQLNQQLQRYLEPLSLEDEPETVLLRDYDAATGRDGYGNAAANAANRKIRAEYQARHAIDLQQVRAHLARVPMTHTDVQDQWNRIVAGRGRARRVSRPRLTTFITYEDHSSPWPR